MAKSVISCFLLVLVSVPVHAYKTTGPEQLWREEQPAPRRAYGFNRLSFHGLSEYNCGTSIMNWSARTVSTAAAALSLLLSHHLTNAAPPLAGSTLQGPRIRVEGETFNFGYVPQHAFMTHTYWLKNPGTETVRIQRLAPNCGCTTAPLTDSVITVGDSIPLEITFGSRGMLGHVEKHVRIFANAAGRIPALTFTADVLPDTARGPSVTMLPRAMKVNPVNQPAKGNWTVEMTLMNNGTQPVDVRAVSWPWRGFKLGGDRYTLQPGEKRPIMITMAPLAGGTLGKSVTFELSDPPGTRVSASIMPLEQGDEQ
ncbi:MAG: DUF1573 domain-containing protein [Candidatus Zixiibacteriota bacterium]